MGPDQGEPAPHSRVEALAGVRPRVTHPTRHHDEGEGGRATHWECVQADEPAGAALGIVDAVDDFLGAGSKGGGRP